MIINTNPAPQTPATSTTGEQSAATQAFFAENDAITRRVMQDQGFFPQDYLPGAGSQTASSSTGTTSISASTGASTTDSPVAVAALRRRAYDILDSRKMLSEGFLPDDLLVPNPFSAENQSIVDRLFSSR